MKNNIIALDSHIFIYQFEDHPHYSKYTSYLFNSFINKSYKGVSSIISLIETLSYPLSPSLQKMITESFKTIPNFTMYSVTEEIGVDAANIRRTYGFRLPDAIQLATARYGNADMFITNDRHLQSFKELKVQLLENVMELLNR